MAIMATELIETKQDEHGRRITRAAERVTVMTSATAPWLIGAGTSTKAGLGITAVTACAVAPTARFQRPRLDRDTPAWRATSSAPNPPLVHRANTRARSSAPKCGRVIINALSSFIPATLHPPRTLA